MLLGCGSLPQSPQVYQCGFFYDKVDPLKSEFICPSSKDPNDVVIRSMEEMHGAQALNLDDFNKMSRYFDEIKKRLIDALNQVQSELIIEQ